MIDCHIHTSLCKHATGEMEEYVVSAVSKGLDEMAFTDHIPLDFPVLRDCCMYERELEGYVRNVLDLKERYKADIAVKLGMEADYIEGEEERIGKIIELYPFDVILGSVHMMDGWAVDHPDYRYRFEEGNVLEIYRRYIYFLMKAVKTGLYDVMAHPDLVKKMNFFPDNADITELFREVVDVIADNDVCMELSSAGLRKPVREQYPGAGILRYAASRNVCVTTGSDAHSPGEVAADFDRMYSLLSDNGITAVCSFTGRERKEIPIS